MSQAAPTFQVSHLSAVSPDQEVRMVDDALLFAQAALVMEAGGTDAVADAAAAILATGGALPASFAHRLEVGR